ncbi:MAG: hypothetical protein AAFU64_18275, partial [Bacteroidota bacterium]
MKTYKPLFHTILLLGLTWALTWGTSLNAQDLDEPFSKVIPPSPTVANLMQFEEVPIDYHTGQPSIAIPIFSKPLHKSLNFGLSLGYNTMGVKIDNRSGWTGTGWSLGGLGVISRTVRGIPDDFYKGENGPNNWVGVLRNPTFWNYDNLSDAAKDTLLWRAVGTSIDQYDTELDLYQFNFPGASGRFVVVLENDSLKAKLLSPESNIKI